ncbi:PAN domain protein [Trichinella nativa]|uniref:PAN domain protein n=1 Tax=Trichinella nativa TaxID=6335 RepID=A0A1Y3EMP1_9BILA|nr:PAN domain protein [Trichinella nativa]
MLCLLESKPLDNHSEVLSSMLTTTVGECIAKCNEANNPCNSVYYIHNAMDERNVCYHLIYKIQAGSDLTKNNEKFLYYIQKCDLGKNQDSIFAELLMCKYGMITDELLPY